MSGAGAPPTLDTPAAMAAWSDAARARGERLAFVPTMGFLHAGHTALMDEAHRHGHRVVLSIFVNPLQFGPNEDLERYPRDLPGDLEKAAAHGVDAVFLPTPANMYPPGHQTTVQVHQLEQGLCGGSRPGHFVGVATVVCKLFNIVRPHAAVFGEKDYQQLALIRRMVRDLDMPVEIVSLPTVREADGLAMSSRNKYLLPDERQRATALSRALFAARVAWAAGERDAARLVEGVVAVVRDEVTRLDYVELRDAESLQPLVTVDRPAVLALAAFVGRTRLIDNVRLG